MFGKGKSKSSISPSGCGGRYTRPSRPLATLPDPASFGPPPRNVNFHGRAALQNQVRPDRRVLVAPLADTRMDSGDRADQGSKEEVGNVRPARPPVPFRLNRTGLRTDHLPPPPIHPIVNDVSATAQETGIAELQPKQKPPLPPRLPPRSKSSTFESPAPVISPPPSYESVADEPKPDGETYINSDAADRLGKAGVSVPGLDIGQSDKASPNEWHQSTTRQSPQFNEFQSRFSLMKTSSLPSSAPSPDSSTQSKGLAQEQAALRTVQSFHKDPSSVSLGDAQSAASTTNEFRKQHQKQIAAGAQKASSWGEKYNITGRMKTFLERQTSSPAQASTQLQDNAGHASVKPDLDVRKPPPPPPKKPSGMPGLAMGAQAQAPPPVPLGTKPSLG